MSWVTDTVGQGARQHGPGGARIDTKETEMALALPPFLGSYRKCGPRKVFGVRHKRSHTV